MFRLLSVEKTSYVSGRLYSLAHLKNIEKFAAAGLKSVT